MRHPILGIPGAKPRQGPSLAQMLKEAEAPAQKPFESEAAREEERAAGGRRATKYRA